MHWNIQGGMVTEQSNMELILENSNIQIIYLNEHWIQKENIPIRNNIPNYMLATVF